MTFSAFFQDNIIYFALATGVLSAILTLEYRGWKTRGCDISCAGLSRAVNSGALLIDLRPHKIFLEEHIAGAKNIPFADLDNHLESLGEKDQEIVFYCGTGGVSSKAVGQLKQSGYSKLKYLNGGLAAWKADNLPLVKKG